VLVGPVSDDVLSRAFGLERPRTLRWHSFVSLPVVLSGSDMAIWGPFGGLF
jgi:hypothetical protein